MARVLSSVSRVPIRLQSSLHLFSAKTLDGCNLKASLYPNPTKGILNIDTDEAIEKIEVYGILGNLLNTVNNTKIVDFTEFPNGFYLVKIKTVEGNEVTQKVMKN